MFLSPPDYERVAFDMLSVGIDVYLASAFAVGWILKNAFIWDVMQCGPCKN
jgi:hypothetical protein